jgi:purine-binding chemotaxis protein CheW
VTERQGLSPAPDSSPDLADVAARIARAIAAAESAPPEARPHDIVFRVGELACALPLSAVREVVLPGKLSRVPRAPQAVLGIMNLRGRVVAVVDLLHALPAELASRAAGNRRPARPGADLAGGRILIVERGRRELGLLVRDVVGIAGEEGAAPTSDHPEQLDPAAVVAGIEALVE